MSFENLQKIADKTVNLDTLISDFNATVRALVIGKDTKSEADVCMMKIEMDDGKVLTQKLKSMHISQLIENLHMMNILDLSQVIDNKFHFKKTEFRIGFPRWLPTKKVR